MELSAKKSSLAGLELSETLHARQREEGERLDQLRLIELKTNFVHIEAITWNFNSLHHFPQGAEAIIAERGSP